MTYVAPGFEYLTDAMAMPPRVRGVGCTAASATSGPGRMIGTTADTVAVSQGGSLVADGAQIRGGVFLSDGFEANGEVRLARAIEP